MPAGLHNPFLGCRLNMLTGWGAVSHTPQKSYNIAIFIRWLMTIEGYDGERVLLSYDVSGTARAVAARVCQLVFGRRRVSEGPERTVYQESGFIHRPGVVWIGQSVLVMPPRDATELAGRLLRLGVRVASAPVSVARSSLEAFRRAPRIPA